MSILTAQDPETSGDVKVFGQHPYENDAVLSRMCFIRESQKYPEDFSPAQAFKSAALFFRNWDQNFADRLAEEFALPLKRRIKKFARQLSAVGVIIGLAARAELTFFDEPYLGLDAVARQIFYDRLVEDYSLHPRTIILSSHLIDEVANLLEHVLLIDHGRVILDDDAENIRGSAATVTGQDTKVTDFTAGLPILHRERLGSLASVTVEARLGSADRARAAELGLELAPVSLQQSWWSGRRWRPRPGEPASRPAQQQIRQNWRWRHEPRRECCPHAADQQVDVPGHPGRRPSPPVLPSPMPSG